MYKVSGLMCDGTGIDNYFQTTCVSCLGEGEIEVSKAEYDKYHENK